MQQVSKKALEMVKADGGNKTRLLAVMQSVDPACTSVPTIQPAQYEAVYNAISEELVNNLLK